MSQQITGAAQEMRKVIREDTRKAIEKLDQKLSRKIDDLSSFVADALDITNSVTNKRLENHEKRLIYLEKRARQ